MTKIIIYIIFFSIANQFALGEPLKFTNIEKTYLGRNQTITIGVLENHKPFAFVEDKISQGLSIDIINLLSKKTGLSIVLESNPWSKNIENFKNNKIDLIDCISYKKERELFTLFTDPYYEVPITIFSRKNFGEFRNNSSLKEKRIGITRGLFYKKELIELGLEVIEFDDVAVKMAALEYGNIELATSSLGSSINIIKTNAFTNIKVLAELKLPGVKKEDLRIGVNIDKPVLYSIINKGLNAVSNQEMMNLKSKWLGIQKVSKNSNTIKLSKQEQLFIKNHTSIILGTEKTWEPYVILDKNNKISGYDNDILQRVNELTGANFQLKAGIWRHMVKLAEEGKIDGLSTGAVHEGRKKYLNFSDTYLSFKKLILVSKMRKNEIQSEKDLAGKTIIFHKGNLADEKIAKKYTNSKIISVNTIKAIIEALVSGEADAAVGDAGYLYLAHKFDMNYLKIAIFLEDQLDLSFGVRKDWPEAIRILNKALATISENERIKIRDNWFEFENKDKEEENRIVLNKEEQLYIDNEQG